MKRLLLRILAVFALLVCASQAQASCTVLYGGATLGFGAYRPLTFQSKTASVDVNNSAAVITVNCNGVVPLIGCLVPILTSTYTLTIEAGSSGDPLARRMPGNHGGPSMNYNLYTDSGRTQVWGNGVTGSSVAGSITGCQSKAYTVYARVPAGQSSLKPGNFGEQLVVTLSFSP